jgi:hypothetical protein
MLFRHKSFTCTSSIIGVLSKLSSQKHEKWWVVYKVNPEIHTRQYDEYLERNEEGDVYQEEIKEDENFKVSDRATLTELATHAAEVMEEEQGPSKKHLPKSQGPPKKSLQKSQ